LTKSGFVIGVNTFKVGGYEGLNFAISAAEIKEAFRKCVQWKWRMAVPTHSAGLPLPVLFLANGGALLFPFLLTTHYSLLTASPLFHTFPQP